MAESKQLHLIIARVEGQAFSGEVTSVTVPGVEGEMTLLANHEAIISPLQAGTITIRADSESDQTFEIKRGTLELSDNKVTILI